MKLNLSILLMTGLLLAAGSLLALNLLAASFVATAVSSASLPHLSVFEMVAVAVAGVALGAAAQIFIMLYFAKKRGEVEVG